MAERSRLLVADDDDQIRDFVSRVLAQNYDVETASDGREAMAKLSAQRFHGLVMDHFMPGATGVEVLQQASMEQPHAARVLVTASERVSDVRDAVNVAHVHRFLCKPVRLEELRRAVDEAVRMARLEDENARLVRELSARNDQLSKALGRVREHEERLEREVEERTRQLRAAMAELEELALRDGLTGLYNHRYFQEALTRELARAARYQHPLGLILLDVDHFKNFNDIHGHPGGDRLLKQLSRMLVNTGDVPEIQLRGRASDIAARYGGEEFVVILPQTPKAGTALRAQRLCEAVAGFKFEGGEVQPGGRVSVSVGVASFPEDAMTKVELIEAADRAMYEAKRGGRNRVRVAGETPGTGEG